MYLCSSARIYDFLNIELGSWRAVDEWIAREEAEVRAFPRGSVLHIAPGNVPQSIVVSILRAIATKNESVIKMSSSDPFTATALMQSFSEIDPKHPVSKSISTAYWATSSHMVVGSGFAKKVDTIIAWGANDAISWARKNAGANTEVVAFGPKQSFAVVGPNQNPSEAARGVVIDICLYDQKACFSTRQAFVHESVYYAFRKELIEHLCKMDKIFPMGQISLDETAIRSLARSHAEFLALLDTVSVAGSWTIIEGKTDKQFEHPLGRTLVIVPFNDPSEIYECVDEQTQTVAVYPWEYGKAIRNECAVRGASRIVECGLSNIFRIGGTHDSIYPLQRLVKWVSQENSKKRRVRGVNTPVDQMSFLENDKFPEFIP